MRRTILAVLLLVVVAGLVGLIAHFAMNRPQPRPTVSTVVQGTMKQWQVPGLALVVVKGDRVLHLEGFGVRDIGKDAPVTPDTVFPLASCTKSFTTLAMGMLVDEGRLGWDDPVRKHLPYFHLADPHADALVTLRDLVTHHTGVGGHDLFWYGSGWSLEERIKHAGKLDLEVPFRSGFRYQVVMFGAAGVAAANAAGTSWQDLVTKRILDPLEMTSTRCSFPADAPEPASPYRKDAAGNVTLMPRFVSSEPDPAGSIHSTARDLGAYLRFQLGDGRWQGRQLISAANLATPQTAQVVLPLVGAAASMNPETQFLTYGMGWVVQDYRGKRLVMHGGAIDGFRAHLTLVPEARLGIGLLSNLDSGLANLAISNSLVDLLLGLPTRDWSSYYLELFEQTEREQRDRAQALRDRHSNEGPPRPLAAYAGSYEDAAYGPCTVEVADGKLMWNWGKVRCPLAHQEGDTFLANHGPLVDTEFTFTASADGMVTAFRMLDRMFRRKK